MDRTFGSYVLRSEERVLRRNGTIVPLPPRAIDTLAVLAEHLGEIVSKEALLAEVWGSDFVEESSLTQSIYRLRRAFAEQDPAATIENVPRRGYRLVVHDEAASNVRTAEPRKYYWAVPLALVFAAVASASLDLRPPSVPGGAAAEPYSIGYYLWSSSRSIADVRKSLPYFDRAIQAAPTSALGYAGVAYADFSLALRDSEMPQTLADVHAGMASAKEALRVDPSSPEAHAAFGQGQAIFGDSAIAERELHRAVQLDGTSLEARTWYGELLMGEGRIDRAIPQFRAAIALNSSWTEADDDLALLLYLRRDYRESAAYAKQSFAREPDDTMAPFVLALANAQLRQRKVAEAALLQLAHSQNPGTVLKAEAALALFYTEDGNRRLAESAIADTQRLISLTHVVQNPSAIIAIAARLALDGKTDDAYAWLARVEPASRRLFLNDARLDVFRRDKRFARWTRPEV